MLAHGLILAVGAQVCANKLILIIRACLGNLLLHCSTSCIHAVVRSYGTDILRSNTLIGWIPAFAKMTNTLSFVNLMKGY